MLDNLIGAPPEMVLIVEADISVLTTRNEFENERLNNTCF